MAGASACGRALSVAGGHGGEKRAGWLGVKFKGLCRVPLIWHSTKAGFNFLKKLYSLHSAT